MARNDLLMRGAAGHQAGLMALVGLGLTGAAHAGTIYVDDDAATGGDGTSWVSAYRHLQDALAASSAGDEIRVAGGVYLPDRSAASPGGSGDRGATFALMDGVAVMGGYAGLEGSNGDARDVEAYPSVLSGDLAQNDHPIATFNHGENVYTVVTSEGVGSSSVLDGFMIRSGWAQASVNVSGAGMHNIGGSPTVRDCTFEKNDAADRGGAMYNEGSDATVTGCTFQANEATAGGAIYNYDCAPSIVDCRFIENETSGDSGGGAIYNYFNANATIDRCEFVDNQSFEGGAIHNRQYSEPVITNSRFEGNRALFEGGAIFNRTLSHPTLINCVFNGNEALQRGGAMTTWVSGQPIMYNCTVWGNDAPSGGAFYNRGADAVPTLVNCVVWSNGSVPTLNLYEATMEIRCSNYEGGGFDPVLGNIDLEPGFVDPTAGDFGLAAGSPCIDAGDNTVLPEDLNVDTNGDPRFMDDPETSNTGICPIGVQSCAPVDLGAREFQTESGGEDDGCSLGDVNCNGSVDVDDLIAVIVAWGQCDGCEADLDNSGLVDVNDLLEVIVNMSR